MILLPMQNDKLRPNSKTNGELHQLARAAMAFMLNDIVIDIAVIIPLLIEQRFFSTDYFAASEK